MEIDELQDIQVEDPGKTITRALLTIQINDILVDTDYIVRLAEKYADYVCWIIEQGSHVHMHLYLELKHSMKFDAMKKLFILYNPHIDKVVNRNAARKYCTPEKNLHGQTVISSGETGIWEPDKGPRISARKQLIQMVEDCIHNEEDQEEFLHKNWKLIAEVPGNFKFAINLFSYARPIREKRDMDVYIYWGETSTGKTERAVNENPSYYILSPPNASKGATWYDKYSGQQCLIIDEFNGWLSIVEMNRICDGHKHVCQIKGGSIYMDWNKIIIISNRPWKTWWPLEDEQAVKERDAFHERVVGRTAVKYTDHIIHFKREMTPLGTYIYSTINEEE